jgi:hypothetical protein
VTVKFSSNEGKGYSRKAFRLTCEQRVSSVPSMHNARTHLSLYRTASLLSMPSEQSGELRGDTYSLV